MLWSCVLTAGAVADAFFVVEKQDMAVPTRADIPQAANSPPSRADLAPSQIGPPRWMRVPPGTSFRTHGVAATIDPDYIWTIDDPRGSVLSTLVLPRNYLAGKSSKSEVAERCPDVDSATCDWPLTRIQSASGVGQGNDVLVLAFCHTAQVMHVKVGRKRQIRCTSWPHNPWRNTTPPLPTAVEHIGAFDTYISHWQHGIINTLPIYGMASAALQAFPNATLVVDEDCHGASTSRPEQPSEEKSAPPPAGSYSSCLLRVRDLNMSALHRQVQSIASLDRFVNQPGFPQAAYGRSPILRNFVFAFAAKRVGPGDGCGGRLGPEWSPSCRQFQLVGGHFDIYPRSAYWPFYQLIERARAPSSRLTRRGAHAWSRTLG